MKTNLFYLHDAHLFAMLRSLKDRIARPAIKKEIQMAMVLAWKLDPRTKEGAKEVTRVMHLAKALGMIEVETGAGNGARLVGLGIEFLNEAVETRRFFESARLWEHYRRVVWQQPPTLGGSMDRAA